MSGGELTRCRVNSGEGRRLWFPSATAPSHVFHLRLVIVTHIRWVKSWRKDEMRVISISGMKSLLRILSHSRRRYRYREIKKKTRGMITESCRTLGESGTWSRSPPWHLIIYSGREHRWILTHLHQKTSFGSVPPFVHTQTISLKKKSLIYIYVYMEYLDGEN